MTDYYSCKHVAQEVIAQDIKRVKELTSARKSMLYTTYHCIGCDFSCVFDRKSLCGHAMQSGHVLFVRNKDPVELYCAACQDFQFSSVLDRALKRKRPRTGLTNHMNGKISSTGIVLRQSKGLCNMGNTCFMSSVLQILMKNPALMNCEQLQMSSDRCKTVIERSLSIDNTSRFSGDSSGTSAVSAAAVATCIFCEFKKLSHEANKEDGCESLVPANLLYAVWSELDYIAGYQQQDAHEFLIAFLDGMDQHLRQNHAYSSGNGGSAGALASGGVSTLSLPPPPPSGYTSSSPRKSPRTESKHRAFPFAAGAAMMLSPPPALRRSVSDNEPPSAGSVHCVPQCAEVLEVFRGSLESNLTCRFCGHESVKRESFLDLSLSLSECDRFGAGDRAKVDAGGRQSMNNEFAAAADGAEPGSTLGGVGQDDAGWEEGEDGERAITLADCLRAFTTLENLGEKIHCAGCARSQDMQKQLFISTPPNVLILHLKRFDMLTGTKITRRVDIPLADWDISEFIGGAGSGSGSGSTSGGGGGGGGGGTPGAAWRQASPGGYGEVVYDLQGLVTHSGTLHGGHYVAYIADYPCDANGAVSKKQWIRCDDETVAVVGEEEVRDAEAYVLFYVKKKFLPL